MLIVTTIVFSIIFAVPVTASGNFTPVTGWEMIERFGMGINIGNTLDARQWPGETWADGRDTETIWGSVRIEKQHFEAIAGKGFNNVRIPVTWTPHMNANGIISKAWMDRVQQCVDWALEAGLIVIINTHHEAEFYEMLAADNISEATAWLIKTWEQIAERFKNYPETLIFEPMNEPNLGSYTGGDWIHRPDGGLDMKLVENTNALNMAALETIRSSGGNNNKRLVALTVPGAQVDCLPHYIHPDDPYTMLGIFYYDGHDFNYIKEFTKRNIPLFIKETSPFNFGTNTLPQQGVIAWTKHYYAELAKLGIPSMWWNCSGANPEELFSRRTGEWNKPLLDAFFAAYEHIPSIVNTTADAIAILRDIAAGKPGATTADAIAILKQIAAG